MRTKTEKAQDRARMGLRRVTIRRGLERRRWRETLRKAAEIHAIELKYSLPDQFDIRDFLKQYNLSDDFRAYVVAEFETHLKRAMSELNGGDDATR